MKYVLIVVFSVLLCFSCTTRNSTPVALRCENSENPLGIDDSIPRLAWQSNDSTRDARQTAYQIQVATSKYKLENNKSDCWDSKQVFSSQSIWIPYTGAKLTACTRYYWRVRTWNENNKVSAWSETAWWETGLMGSAWKALWITKPDMGAPLRSVLLRNTFMLKAKIKSARVYTSGLGSYQLFINGMRISNDCFTPGWTDYTKRVQYQVYDVTREVKEGGNAVGAWLGSMWWSSGLAAWQKPFTYSKGPLRFIMQLIVNYHDGKADTICTNDQWKSLYSAILTNNLYKGEFYDARLEQPGWNNTGFEDKNWENAQVISQTKNNLVASAELPIRVTQTLEAAKIVKLDKGEYVFDFGQNMAGVARLFVKGNAGDTIRLKYAELIHPNKTVAQENLRSARATDYYILRGAPNGEIYQPRFTYHGFRYVQVKGLRSKPDSNTLVALVMHSDAAVAGSFECSNALINKIWANTQRSQQSNMMSVPTDCPQRDERLGWMGDAQVFAPTSMFAMNMQRFYSKWMTDIADGQDKSGYVLDVNPAVLLGPAKPGWGDAVVIIPWQLYTWYADTDILRKHYKNMKAWVEYMHKQSKNNLYTFTQGNWNGYGDWVAVATSPTKPIGSLYYYQSTTLLARIAGVLHYKDDSAHYASLATAIATAYQQHYYQRSSGQYEGATQFANLMPLAFEITPEALRKEVAQKLADNIRLRDNHISTGFLGTAYLLPELSRNGYHNLAYTLATQETYPSWGYMIKQGATTMWERWNSDKEKPEEMNSRNHFAFGSVSEWFWRSLAGINPLPVSPGFKHFKLAPKPVDGLTWVKASYASPYGIIRSEWKTDNGKFRYTFTIPANSTAQVDIPIVNNKKPTLREGKDILYSDGKANAKYPFAQFVGNTDEVVTFIFKSGTYTVVY